MLCLLGYGMHACLLCEGKFRGAFIKDGTASNADSKLLMQWSLATWQMQVDAHTANMTFMPAATSAALVTT